MEDKIKPIMKITTLLSKSKPVKSKSIAKITVVTMSDIINVSRL